jgi:hypothetical protein
LDFYFQYPHFRAILTSLETIDAFRRASEQFFSIEFEYTRHPSPAAASPSQAANHAILFVESNMHGLQQSKRAGMPQLNPAGLLC